ncbi:hypothetical protein ACWDR0_02775 [Streptomyces sp. NPDC003691]
MKTKTGVTVLVAAACASVLMAPSPAGAAQAPEAGSESGNYCVIDAATKKSTCYDSHRTFISVLTGGRITDAPETAEEALRDKKFQARLKGPVNTAGRVSAQGEVSGVTFYQRRDFQGRAFGYALNSLCTNDGAWDLSISDIAAEHGADTDNMISAVQTWGNCAVELYSDTRFRGDKRLFTVSPHVGNTIDNRASSYRLKAIGESAR